MGNIVFDDGDVAYCGSREVLIIKQVLFNNPAFRVIDLSMPINEKNNKSKQKRITGSSYVCDGSMLKKSKSKYSIEMLLSSNKESATSEMVNQKVSSSIEIFKETNEAQIKMPDNQVV